VLVRIGEPIDLDTWRVRTGSDDASRLTADIAVALRRVTLNFASDARARRAVALAQALAAITDTPPALGRPRTLAAEAEIALRIETATSMLTSAPLHIARQADAFIARVEALEAGLALRHVGLADLQISPRLRHGARFMAREGILAALALPVALLGRVTHWVPFHLARALAMRPMAQDPSRDQPAMRTIVLGLGFVLLCYAFQGALVAQWFGAPVAALWLAAIFLAAHIDFLLRDRLHRAWRRARAYLVLRADPTLRNHALEETRALVADAIALEQALFTSTAAIPI
jgi:hypothetical protein